MSRLDEISQQIADLYEAIQVLDARKEERLNEIEVLRQEQEMLRFALLSQQYGIDFHRNAEILLTPEMEAHIQFHNPGAICLERGHTVFHMGAFFDAQSIGVWDQPSTSASISGYAAMPITIVAGARRAYLDNLTPRPPLQDGEGE